MTSEQPDLAAREQPDLSSQKQLSLASREQPDLSSRISKLTAAMERLNIAEYVALLHNPWRLFYLNLLAGVARGMGYLLGFAILGTLLVYILQLLVASNLPLIGDFIADVVKSVESQVTR